MEAFLEIMDDFNTTLSKRWEFFFIISLEGGYLFSVYSFGDAEHKKVVRFHMYIFLFWVVYFFDISYIPFFELRSASLRFSLQTF